MKSVPKAMIEMNVGCVGIKSIIMPESRPMMTPIAKSPGSEGHETFGLHLSPQTIAYTMLNCINAIKNQQGPVSKAVEG